MNKSTKLFEIDDFNLWDDEIEVFMKRGDTEREKSIPRARFERWLSESGRLDWEDNKSDHTGEHVQETGTMTIDEYWSDCHFEQKCFDLYDYLVLHMDARKVFDVESSIFRILATAFAPANQNFQP